MGRRAVARLLGALWIVGALAGCGGVAVINGGKPVGGSGLQNVPAGTPPPPAATGVEPPLSGASIKDGRSRPLPFAVPAKPAGADEPEYEYGYRDILSDPSRARTHPRPGERVPPTLQRRSSRIDDFVNAGEYRSRLEQLRRDQSSTVRTDSRQQPTPDLNERRRYGTDMRADRY